MAMITASTPHHGWCRYLLLAWFLFATIFASVWEEFIDEESGEPYYYNLETQETSWDAPQSPDTVINREDTQV